jgi:hypothetical protein
MLGPQNRATMADRTAADLGRLPHRVLSAPAGSQYHRYQWMRGRGHLCAYTRPTGTGVACSGGPMDYCCGIVCDGRRWRASQMALSGSAATT